MSNSRPAITRTDEPADQKQALDRLCTWIEAHLDEPIGWQELMRESGQDFKTIHQWFFRYTSMTPMTWIRRLRERRSRPPADRTVLRSLAINQLPGDR